MERDDWLLEFSRIAQTVRTYRADIITMLTAVETYKTAEIEVDKTAQALETYRAENSSLDGRRPVGRVAVFLPFNTPFYSLILLGCGPVLAGNQVEVRPSSLTAQPLQAIYKLITSRHPLLLKYLTLSSKGAKEFLNVSVSDPSVGAIIFTGRWESAVEVVPRIPPHIKFIYSGTGLSPFVVLEDADLDAAVECAISSRLFNSGQDCLCTERYYIADKVFNNFAARLIKRVGSVVVGSNSDPSVDVGPLIVEALAKRVQTLLSVSSCSVLYQGSIQGATVTPFVVEASQNMPIVQEEKFASVFPLVRFFTSEEAIHLVNSTEYLLAATVFGRTADVVGRAFDMPHVAYNESILDIESSDAHVLFGGRKRSGFVQKGNDMHDGPLLFSHETSEAN